MTVILLLLSAAIPVEPCLTIEGAQITAAALGGRFGVFRNLDPETPFGYSPSPGLTRLVRAQELRSFAERHGLSFSGTDELCVQRPSRVFTREEVEQALRAALAAEGLHEDRARLDLLDFCRIPLPAGKLTFRLKDSIRPPAGRPDAVTTWRGRVVFDGQRSAPFWAAIRLSVECQVLVAARPIQAGKAIASEDVRSAVVTLPAHDVPPPARIEEILGMEARRNIRDATPLAMHLLVKPREVQPGQKVRVEVESASARLVAEGKAITGGRRGDSVLVENLDSRKKFRAVVAGKGDVTVRLEKSNEALRNSDGRSIR